MQANRGTERLFLSLLACGLCLPGLAAGAGIAIQTVEVDGHVRALPTEPAAAGRDQRPLRVSSTARSLRFRFTNDAPASGAAVRLRYKLEGYDETWQDLPVKMRVMVHFCDRNRDIVGSNEFYLEGETRGWRHTAESSDFVSRREHATAPERSAIARIACLSHSSEPAVGAVGIDAVRVLVEHPGENRPQVFDLSVTKGTDLTHPLGSPTQWMREGSRAELAQLRTRPTPQPHPILVLVDDDPQHFGNWSTVPAQSVPVRTGDRLTIEWQTAHSIGGSGPGQADYGALKPGSYWFRVAAVKAHGEPTGEEVSLPVEVLVPVYFRVDFWLVASALVLGAAAWIGRVAVQRRMQRRIAEIEHEQALDKERARIARDLHDEIGAGLTEIAMQSDWVRRDLGGADLPDTQRRIESVCQSAVDLVRSVDEIVWAVNPANDTIERFVNYLAQSSEQFLEAAGLRVRFDIPEQLPVETLTGTHRHLLFLAVREALNNAVKHAQADLVRLAIQADASRMLIAVEDNGCGFEQEETGIEGTHEGLENMKRRMREIGGQFHLTSRPSGGTRVEFRVPLSVG